MKRVLSLLLALCLMLCMVVPALAAEPEAPDITAETVQTVEAEDGGIEGGEESTAEAPSVEEPPALSIEEPTVEEPPVTSTEEPPVEEPPAPPTEEPTIEESPAGPTTEELPETSDALESAPDVSLFSDFTGGDATFNTRIVLTVTDRDGNPLEGAVYGLYANDGTFVAELVTGSDGKAESPDVPVDTDYYIVELTPPEGFLPNEGQKEIKLTDVCAPSSIDVTAEYDPITGQIKVIKTDPDGNPLAGTSFYVYDADDYSNPVDDITTGEDGTAITKSLPYGEYELYEYAAPEGFSEGGYYGYYTITGQDEIVEATITNYQESGILKITKTGNDGRKIQGAVFSIYNADTDEWVQDATTGSSGYVYVYGLLLGDYYAVEKSVPAPYELDETRHSFSLTYDGEYSYLNLTNNVSGESGRLKVIKTDDENNPLSGVVFGLYRSWDSAKLAELTSGEDGTAESGELIPGDYYLLEQTGKEGYTPASGQIPFTIDGSGVTVDKTVINPKIHIFGKVKVIKEDDVGTPIPGVRFGLYCEAGNLLETLTSDEDGTAVSGVLNEGSYYLLEQDSGIEGYQIDAERHPFSITENETVIPVTVVNPRITGSVKVIKTGTDGQPLPGVVFGVYTEDGGTELCQLTTAEDGTATSGTLFYGSYILQEKSTVDGYELLNTPIPFSILEQDVTVEIPVTNPLILGGVEIQKTDEDGSPLAGAVFGLYSEQGQLMARLTCDEAGRAEYAPLPKGRFYLKELQAPEGFTLPDSMIPFEIATQGQAQKITVENAKGYGTVKVAKTGEGGEPLSGVKFDVIRVSTGETAGELLTDETGAASLELPLGRYELVETATVPGYILLSGSVPFSLTVNGDTVNLPITNRREVEPTPRQAVLRVVKQAEGSNEKLQGAVFGVYLADGTKAGSLTTRTDGTAEITLNAGNVYLLEEQAPAGYRLNAGKIPAVLKAGQTTEIIVWNAKEDTPEKPGTLQIVKVDGSGKKLQGAVFGIYEDGTDRPVGQLTTDGSGAAMTRLDGGSFYVRELQAPDGYRLNDTPIRFTVGAGETVTLTVRNDREDEDKPGILRIIKENEDGDRLKGAVFGIYEDGDKIDEITTDRDGEAEIELDEGDYTIRELEAPRNYERSSKKIRVHITAGKTKEITVENRKKDEPAKDTGTLQIVKQAPCGQRLEGAVFGIYRERDGAQADEVTTGRDGTAEITLDEGRYFLSELVSPAGFQLDTQRHPFTVKGGVCVTVTVTDEPIQDGPCTPPPSVPDVTIPKTGEPFPALQYGLAALCIVIAALSGAAYCYQRKKK